MRKEVFGSDLKSDHRIPNVAALGPQEEQHPEKKVILVSKDICLLPGRQKRST